MTAATTTDLRAALAEKLTREGTVSDPAWRDAFATVPRETFVPYFFRPRQGQPGWRLVEGDQEWHDGVYTDDAHVTQINGDETAVHAARQGATVEGHPTSSSSAPTLMATMLEALDVDEHMGVLEIGTGTGYNAALLAHRLGSDRVATVEFDPMLATTARARLAEAGYTPTVACADGAAGLRSQAPYDRVIATVALPRVPPPWLEQARTGAVIVVPLRFAGHGGLMARLTREGHGGASGRFLAQYGGFMSIREVAGPGSPAIRPGLLAGALPTEVPPEALTGRHPAAFYLSLRSPCRYTVLGFTPDDESTGIQTWGRGTEGSTFALTTTNGITLAAAAGPLWAEIHTAYAEWCQLGRPDRDRFGLTVTPDEQFVWLDDPRNPVTTIMN